MLASRGFSVTFTKVLISIPLLAVHLSCLLNITLNLFYTLSCLTACHRPSNCLRLRLRFQWRTKCIYIFMYATSSTIHAVRSIQSSKESQQTSRMERSRLSFRSWCTSELSTGTGWVKQSISSRQSTTWSTAAVFMIYIITNNSAVTN